MIQTTTYKVELRLDGVLIGDVRQLAQGLKWTRRRTRNGADAIDFTINDRLFADWCAKRNITLGQILRPFALDCRLIRDGVEVIGGYLASMPAYSAHGVSADLTLHFDGYLNLLAGVYMNPIGTQIGKMGALVSLWIQTADARAANAGKAFGFTEGEVSSMASIQYTFDNYKPIKEAICDRCDNISGAGPFDVFFHADRTYDIISDADFGDRITDYVIRFPMSQNNVSATTITAPEVQGFASAVIGIGAGEVSADKSKNTAITYERTNREMVELYGYCEELIQESSISNQATLNSNVATELSKVSNPQWTPQVSLTGRQISPTPSGDRKIWIGDRVEIDNSEDATGMTSGLFRVNELAVAVSAAGGETITPVLERA